MSLARLSSIYCFYNFQLFLFNLKKYFSGYVSEIIIKRGLFFYIAVYPESLLNLIAVLKEHLAFQYKMLVDICVMDSGFAGSWRYTLNYVLLSVKFENSLMVSLKLKDLENVCSMTRLFYSAGWVEREVWDMFGIFFKGNLNLRSILTDYGFLANPLSKDFPLSGYFGLIYNDFSDAIMKVKAPEPQVDALLKFRKWWNL